MKLSDELIERGFVYQCSAESVAAIFDGEKQTVYLGIDPTADAIHIGNLVPFMMLNHIMNAGHRVILLLGGGTALIGDPSGRDTERELVSVEKIKEQARVMEAGVKKLSTGEITFVNNFDWLSKLSAIDFMRDVGKHFTVNALVKRDSVSRRMECESGISYTEFSYSLLQAYDYLHLHQTEGVTVQIGGSDQWGNLVAGIDLVRRVTGNTVHALTMPLIVDKASGKKFGKSMGNAVWLSSHKTSPYELYQFWLQTSDESVIDYLKLFTFIPLSEIATIAAEHAIAPERRLAQKRLAEAVITFVHGAKALEMSQTITDLLFGERTLAELDNETLAAVTPNAPVTAIISGTPLIDVLLTSGLASSKREAREFLSAGAIAINETTFTNESEEVTESRFGRLAILRRGKKQRVFITLN